MTQTIRELKELNLLDDFLFGTITSYPEIGEAFSRELLQIIFQRKFGKLTVTPQKVFYGADTKYRGTRLDVYLEENSDVDSGQTTTIYDVEPNLVNTTESIKSLPKRVRFYHAKIDSRSLKKGESYNKLKTVVVVMITPFDPFGYDRMIYTIKNSILELPDVEYEDGAMTLFLYTKGRSSDAPEELQKLLLYMEESIEKNVTTDAIRRIHDMVETVKSDQEVSDKYMKVLEQEEIIREEGKKAGIIEGIKAGIIEGIKEGRQMERANTEREKLRADKYEKELKELQLAYEKLIANS